jgi:hypothetical protein
MAPPHRRWFTGLVAAGLAATGTGFAGAGIDAGPGPRTVHGSLTLGPLYLPPLLVALAAFTLAALAVTRIRWAAGAGAGFAGLLLAGSATFGAAAISYRLGHPAAAIPFAEDTLQLLGEAIAAGAGIAATMRLLRQRQAPGSRTGPAGARQTAGRPRTTPGGPRRSHQPDGAGPGRAAVPDRSTGR